MSSINTNAGAMTALQTLKATNKSLETTQGRIATGFRVSEAAHNAAYWSIATTMRSDNKAMGTVQDALGLGAAQVDVAYTAMDASKDLLDEIKTKLVAASQPGVDKSKIQSEIKSLQNSLKSLADSASFSGGNWLSIDSKSASHQDTASVVGSYNRGEGGVISLGTVDVDVKGIALFDKGGAGLLQKAGGNDKAGIFAESGTSGAESGKIQAQVSTAAITALTAAETTVTFLVNGEAQTLTWTPTATAVPADAQAGFIAAVNAALEAGTLSGFTVEAGTGTAVNLKTTEGGSDKSIQIVGVTGAGVTGLAATAAGAGTDRALTTFTAPAEAITLDDNDSISFQLELNGTKHEVKIDKATALTAGLTEAADGTVTISDLDDYEAVLTKALTNLNLVVDDTYDAATPAAGSDVTVDQVGGKLIIASSNLTADSKVEISNLRTSSGSAAFDVLDLDITSATNEQLSGYIQGLDDMLSAVTTAASDLGAIKTRINSQSDFVGKLMDAVSRGIGQLVDADMEQESTRLQALQVQQQLGVQALSIANSNTQMILSLFR